MPTALDNGRRPPCKLAPRRHSAAARPLGPKPFSSDACEAAAKAPSNSLRIAGLR
jgi:hypothetical protein